MRIPGRAAQENRITKGTSQLRRFPLSLPLMSNQVTSRGKQSAIATGFPTAKWLRLLGPWFSRGKRTVWLGGGGKRLRSVASLGILVWMTQKNELSQVLSKTPKFRDEFCCFGYCTRCCALIGADQPHARSCFAGQTCGTTGREHEFILEKTPSFTMKLC
ncbi:hypothetical protein BJX96DRAFT_103588 [Aspergillus floccosus]